MNNKKHTVTISGDEYLDYIELKNSNNTAIEELFIRIRKLTQDLIEEKANKTIIVELRKNFSGPRQLQSAYTVVIDSIDSVTQTRILSEKIKQHIHPIVEELEKSKGRIEDLESKLVNSEISKYEIPDKKYSKKELIKMFFS